MLLQKGAAQRAVCRARPAPFTNAAPARVLSRGHSAQPQPSARPSLVCLSSQQDSSSQFDVDAPKSEEPRLELGPRDDEVGLGG